VSDAPTSGEPNRDLDAAEVVELVVPADARYLSAVRVLAATLAADAGFDVDDLERVRIAVNELMMALVEALGPDDRVRVELRRRGGARSELVVAASADRGPVAAGERPGALTVDELAERILAAVAPDYRLRDDGFDVTIAAGDVALAMSTNPTSTS